MQLSILPIPTITECGCWTRSGQWLVCVSDASLPSWDIHCWQETLWRFFPLPLWQAIPEKGFSALWLPRTRLTYYRASTLTVIDMVWEGKKNSLVSLATEIWGVVTPPWSCISWLLLTFISIVPYDLTPTDLSELFPHLFFPFPFCSATLAVPEYISFISNLGFCTVQKRFMATSLHDPLLHPHLYSTVSFLERMSLTMCLKYCPLLPSLFIPF